MKADKKISIKVKSKTEQRIMEDPEVEMITEWNIQRILVALIVLILFLVVPAYYFSRSDKSSFDESVVKDASALALSNKTDIKKQNSFKEPSAKPFKVKASPDKNTSQQALAKNAVKQIPHKQQATNNKIPPQSEPLAIPANLAENTDSKNRSTKVAGVNKPQQTTVHEKPADTKSLNAHVIRALLAQGVNKLEPFGQVELPLLVNDSQAQGITYFTEVSDMQGETVFHEWLKQGEIIYKRKIHIGGKRWRFYTSKLFTYSSNGQWQVRVITEQGDILHQMDFSVEKR